MPAITVQSLSKVFGDAPDAALDRLANGATKADVRRDLGCTVAVHNVSFAVEPEEIFVVMGLSGSGKSTLLRCLNRLVEPTRGTVQVHGEDITSASDARLREVRRQTMAMVFQTFGLFPHRSVLDNVAYGLEVSGMATAQRHDKARDTLARVGLDDYADSRPAELSGGMQQRVGLARALATDPAILLMDEAFSALDPLLRADMQDELRDLQQRWDPPCTIVFITHDLDEALALGDRIGLMKEGELVQVGTPTEILLQPATDYVRAFVQNVNRMEVLPARAVMRPCSDDPTDPRGRAVTTDTPLSAVLPDLLASNAPIPVRNADGTVLGVVDREAVQNVLQEDRISTPT